MAHVPKTAVAAGDLPEGRDEAKDRNGSATAPGGVANAVALSPGGQTFDAVAAQRLRQLEERRRYREETERLLAEKERDLQEIKTKLRAEQLKAAEAAGRLGLLYDPKIDWLVRPVLLEPMTSSYVQERLGDEPLDERPEWIAEDGSVHYLKPGGDDADADEADSKAGPARADSDGHRLEDEAVDLQEEPYEPYAVPYPDWIGWLIAVFAGAFVGYGVGLLSGVLGSAVGSTRTVMTFVVLLVGIALVAGMKVAIGTMWFTVGRQTALRSNESQGLLISLAGLITALLCQHLPPFEAAWLGVWLHGLAGDLAAEELGEVSLIASDLLRFLPLALRAATQTNV